MLIGPDQPCQQVEVVYPLLIGVIEEALAKLGGPRLTSSFLSLHTPFDGLVAHRY